MRLAFIPLLGFVALGAVRVPAQAPPPATEIYLAPLTSSTAGVKVGTPVNISNNAEYDNQPSFLADSSGVLFTSIRGGKPTDIYRYDITSKAVSQLTHTDENEYSPLVTPDGKTFSVVHGADQQLWRFDLDGSKPRLAYAHKGLIGYHAWIDATHLAVFILGGPGAPATLQLVDTATGAAEVVDKNIGRSILIRPGRHTVSYISKAQPNDWMVNELDPKTHAITPLVKTPIRSEDSAWTPDGTQLMGQQSHLFSWRAGGAAFADIADLSTAGLTSISRLAVSPDGHWLAIVALPKTSTPTPSR